mmetsp:Transcript_16712/g.32967  ORF Transcript_16712/g.32967 Transcript_16712/m.32967 type:complete len:260 (-) Transcript_16712:704-1483(-)
MQLASATVAFQAVPPCNSVQEMAASVRSCSLWGSDKSARLRRLNGSKVSQWQALVLLFRGTRAIARKPLPICDLSSAAQLNTPSGQQRRLPRRVCSTHSGGTRAGTITMACPSRPPFPSTGLFAKCMVPKYTTGGLPPPPPSPTVDWCLKVSRPQTLAADTVFRCVPKSTYLAWDACCDAPLLLHWPSRAFTSPSAIRSYSMAGPPRAADVRGALVLCVLGLFFLAPWLFPKPLPFEATQNVCPVPHACPCSFSMVFAS